MDWEQAYRNAETIWGEKPDHLLVDIAPQVPKGKVLDLGMGEGRNAVFFAAQGYDVKGIDLSPTAVEKCLQRARSLNIPLQAEAANLLDVTIEPNSQALIISTMVLQFIKKSEGEVVIQRIKDGLQPGGMVYLTLFSTDDPWINQFRQHQPEVEPNTFFHQRMNSHVHFFEKDELLTGFQDFKLHQIAQTTLLDHGHPGVPDPHYHGILTYIGQKP